MKIGIDVSQLQYEGTGVSLFLTKLIEHLFVLDKENTYVFFGSSLRGEKALRERVNKLKTSSKISQGSIIVKTFPFPVSLLDFLWNRLHLFPIEWFIGDIDVFITSDWTEPPVRKARKATILYDLIVFIRPQETDRTIIAVQKRKLAWVKKESSVVFCISESTRQDARRILGIEDERLRVMYPAVAHV